MAMKLNLSFTTACIICQQTFIYRSQSGAIVMSALCPKCQKCRSK